MNKKIISEAIGNISNRHIEEAADFQCGKKKPVWVKWGAMAACLCVVVAGAFSVVKYFSDNATLPVGVEIISADGLWAEGFGSHGTDCYAVKSFKQNEAIPISPVQDNNDVKTLSVYRSLNAQSSSDTYQFLLTWAEDISKLAKANLGIELHYNIDDVLLNGMPYDDNAPTDKQYMFDVNLKLYHGETALTLLCVSEGMVTFFDLRGVETLYNSLAEEALLEIENPTDEAVLSAVEPIVTFVNELTGEKYALDTASISRKETENGNLIGLRVQSSIALGSELSWEMTEPLFYPRGFTITLQGDDDGNYRLTNVSINEQYREYVGEYELISLAEAEEYLYKGYSWGGVQCPLCKLNDPHVDFSEYDFVQIEYYGSLSEYALPYYTFYKYLGTTEYQDIEGLYVEYAVAYVPAIEIEGLDEYFKEQAAQHTSNQ